MEAMIGKIDAVRGTVIEVQFQDPLHAIGAALQCQAVDRSLTAVEHSHIGDAKVQAIALDSTRGRRGSLVGSHGNGLTIPVGAELLGRVIDLTSYRS
jgi:F0F1-type ATP synthase beta subunit